MILCTPCQNGLQLLSRAWIGWKKLDISGGFKTLYKNILWKFLVFGAWGDLYDGDVNTWRREQCVIIEPSQNDLSL